MQDGRILGPNSELLFWVPPTLRIGLLHPGNKSFIGKFVQTRLNLDNFVHGDSWTLCKSRDDLDNDGVSDGERLNPLTPHVGSNPNTVPGPSPRGSSGHAKRKASQTLSGLPGVVDITKKKARLEGNISK
jgi:hypothetical protein